MKKEFIAGLMLGLGAASAEAVCPYALNATADQIRKAGYLPFPARTGQSAAFTVRDNSTSLYGLRYGAGSYNGAKAYLASQKSGQPGGDVKLPASGTVAVEFKVDNYATGLPGSNPAAAGIGFGVSSGNIGSVSSGPMLDVRVAVVDENSAYAAPRIQVEARSRSGTGAPVVRAVAQQPLALPLPPEYRVGLYFNRSTAQVGYVVNGVDAGALTDSAGNPLLIPAGLTAFSIGVGGGNAGIQVGDPLIGTYIGGTLITDAALMTQPYPAGTTDICGVPR
ncbi:MAG: putative exported protein [Moraxellaceae bacterium]|jgi:hypothetical protein|nr:putative exported protein [Moraxellaceae bacterium]